MNRLYNKTRNLDINFVDCSTNSHTCESFDFCFQKCLIPLKNKSNCTIRLNVALVNHILANTLNEYKIQSTIAKIYVSDHFAIFTLTKITGKKWLRLGGYNQTFTLREMFPYPEFFWSAFCLIWTQVREILSPNTEKCGQVKLWIRTLFTQC